MPTGVDHASIVAELKAVRRAGLVRLRGVQLTALRRAAELGAPDGSVEGLLRRAVSALDAGTLRTAAAYTLGLAQGTRDWPAADRRRRAAEVYGVSVERFRKDHEVMVLEQIAEAVTRLAATTEAPGRRPDGTTPDGTTPDGAPTDGGTRTHRVVEVPAGGRTLPLTVHVHPVDLLRDVDVVVSPANTHLALPETYKSSVAASLRRAGSVRGVTGDLMADPVSDELRAWADRHGTAGRPVLPGTVAATPGGALAARGVRRIYHAVVAVPRAGTNDYEVLPADITRAATRVFEVMAEERDGAWPQLRSVCFPLLGAGRGGLPRQVSLDAIWAAVEAEAARGADWEIHVVVRDSRAAELVERLPERVRPSGHPRTT
ncbi:macro domain-containing protein [Streptomyces sp. NPDC006458]|uniref:macro domain-containing protein n=1 Tax=Streptomyces sp. NPDC006458 TaxID=3154302 RepID=UPI0033A6E1D8